MNNGSSPNKMDVVGYLPDETPSFGKLIVFALQQVLVMFPATVTVALLTGFHISTTIFASGLATLSFLLVTRGKIPLYYGSSFAYIAAIVGVTGATFGQVASDALIGQAQFGIIMSGFVSIIAGLIVRKFGMAKIEKILPPHITGSIALIIGVSLMVTAMTQSFGYADGALVENASSMVIAASVTFAATAFLSVYLHNRGVWGQLPILFGILIGFAVSIPLGLVDFSTIMSGEIIQVPHFTLPIPNVAAVLAIMPIALATIPESAAHLFQIDLYVNHLAKQKGKAGKYQISNKLGENLVGDGLADIVSAFFGGPAGTNYGENVSTMSITRNFSVKMLGMAAIIAMILAFVSPIANFISSIPGAVINGACIFLFGVIGVQGIAIMVEKKVNMFNPKILVVVAFILTFGIGGHYGFPNGSILVFGFEIPAIAGAAILGIILNLLLSIGQKNEDTLSDEKKTDDQQNQ